MTVEDEAVALNRAHWDDRAVIHARDADGFYRIAEFKAGADTLSPIESAEIGDVRGLRVLHLQCHLGLDTLSLVRRGAQVTGIDFSSRALEFARQMAETIGLAATFIEGDVRSVTQLVQGPFDLVFATWGVLSWVPDVRGWMQNAATLLGPGGRLYLADIHPFSEQFDELPDASGSARLMVAEPWRTTSDKPLVFTEQHTYTGDRMPIAHAECREWVHPLSDILAAVDDAGLALQMFHEHEATTYRQFRSMRRSPDGLWRLPPGRPKIPHAFSLMALRRV